MSITTYSELQTAVGNWLVRGDLVARVPEFISLAEARLNRVLRKRQAEIDLTMTGVVGARSVALPAAYSEALNCWITLPDGTDRGSLRFVDPARLDTSTIAGRPYAWTIDGANLAFERPCDQAYVFTLRVIEKYALSTGVPTNTLLTDAPDIYLFSALAEAGPFLRDADVTQSYETKLDRAIQELNAQDARSRAQQTLSTEPGMLTRAGHRNGSGFDITSGGWR